MEPTAILISIDGNIGSGKSTALSYLKAQFPNWHFIDEPVDTWTQFKNEENENLLEVFYKDKKRWAYTFQNCAFMTRTRAIVQAIKEWKQKCLIDPEEMKNNIFITERCVETDFNVFAKMLHESKLINKMEWDIYRQWYRYLSGDCKLYGIIYIQCNPEICSMRIRQRARQGEDIIPMEYLKDLDKYHNDWINNTSIPVLNLNTEYNVANDYKEQITKFVKNVV